MIELAYTVIAPLVAGQLLQYLAPKAVDWVKSKVNTANVSQFCILLLVWATFSTSFAGGGARAPASDVAAVAALDALVFVIAVALAFLLAWPPVGGALRLRLRCRKGDAVAVVICGSTKTVALGVPLISTMYGKVPYAGLLAAPLIIYHALQILLGGAMLRPLVSFVFVVVASFVLFVLFVLSVLSFCAWVFCFCVCDGLLGLVMQQHTLADCSLANADLPPNSLLLLLLLFTTTTPQGRWAVDEPVWRGRRAAAAAAAGAPPLAGEVAAAV